MGYGHLTHQDTKLQLNTYRNCQFHIHLSAMMDDVGDDAWRYINILE